MAADSNITVLKLGTGGVDVDSDPILTADSATLQSQNATYDPTSSRAGALSKRPGLDRFNTVSLGFPVLGGIEAPFAGTAGAPISGGGGSGLPGDPGGTIGGQPSPGNAGGGSYGVGPGSNLTIGTNAPSGGSTGAGAAAFNGGSPVFGGKKIIVVGRTDNINANGDGWYLTSKGFNDIAKLLTSPGPPMNGVRLARVAGSLQGGNVGQTANHDAIVGFPQSVTEGLAARPGSALFYPGRISVALATGPAAFVAPVIRMTNGATDTQVATIPPNNGTAWPITATGAFTPAGSGQHGSVIVGMGTKYGDGSTVFVAVMDRTNSTTGSTESTVANTSRIFSLDTSSYALSEVFNTTPITGSNYNAVIGAASPLLSGGGNPIWFGTMQQTSTGVGGVYALVTSPGFPDDFSDWTGYEGVYAVESDVTCMAIYQGCLFVGHANQAGTPAFAVINGNPLSSGETLSGNPLLTATGGSAVAGNFFVSMAIFLGKLYVSYYNATQIAKIYCVDSTFTWTTVFTSGTFSGDLAPMNLQVDSDGDILYAFGCVDGTPPAIWMTSVDGVNWVNKTGNLTGDLSASGGGNFTTSYPMNIFADFNQ